MQRMGEAFYGRSQAYQTALAASGEQAFRLLVDELPLNEGKQNGVQYVLRYSVPVFVGASGTPSLQWSGTFGADGLAVDVRNSGTMHAQISEIGLSASGGAPG